MWSCGGRERTSLRQWQLRNGLTSSCPDFFLPLNPSFQHSFWFLLLLWNIYHGRSPIKTSNFFANFPKVSFLWEKINVFLHHSENVLNFFGFVFKLCYFCKIVEYSSVANLILSVASMTSTSQYLASIVRSVRNEYLTKEANKTVFLPTLFYI